MGQKDKVEKLLEDYPDVFADIINVFVYQGRQIVKSEELITTDVKSQYKASDNTLHEEERFLKLNLDGKKEGEITMCTILDAAEQRGISQGISQGISRGKMIGEDLKYTL